MKLQQLSLLMLVIVIGNISEICAQFKVIKMESQRSLTLEDESTSAALKNVTYITHFVKGNRSKYRRDSNVTVIQIMPSEKLSRRIKEIIAPATEETTKIASNISSSYHEIITVTPTSSNDTSNLLKLHILSLRMGKIQENMRPKPFRKKPTASEIESNKNDNKKSIIRIQQQQQDQQQQPSPNEIVISKKYPIKSYEKPYKMRNKWKSTKCFCQQNDKFWRCRKIQMSIARCRSDQFMCCI